MAAALGADLHASPACTHQAKVTARCGSYYSQNMTAAARATAERKTLGYPSQRVATRHQSFRRPNMISILLQRL
jgi:hypothetical protein